MWQSVAFVALFWAGVAWLLRASPALIAGLGLGAGLVALFFIGLVYGRAKLDRARMAGGGLQK